jgi:DNA-binding transcriptional LysR family regulator
MLTLDDLRLLSAVRATGSLSRAARDLGKAVSTISHAARQLEGRLDALLFDRRGYRIALTAAGQLLVDEGARLHGENERLARRVQQVARGWESQLRIAVDELVNFQALLPLVHAFDTLQSGVQLRFTHESVGGTWEALQDGRADLVVAATNEPPAIAGLKWFELGVLDWVFAVSPHHALARAREPLSSEMIKAHRAVVVADSARHGNRKTYGVQADQTVLAVPGMQEKIAAQRAGLGCGWLPRSMIAQHLKSGALVARRTEADREPNVLYVGWIDGATGRALKWWTQQLREPRLAAPLFGGDGS